MPGESISQIPQQALVIGSKDLLMISQYTGNLSAPYVTKKAAVGLLPSVASYFTVGRFTLDSFASSTTVVVLGCLPTSTFGGLPCPLTPSAGNDVSAGISFAMGTGEFIVYHANNPGSSRTFSYVIYF
jgi:hypothetical protein